uniref:ATP-dependent helicase C-terminal domain-containing protein n=1 Tax=Eucampia antarctica TaxID=49252 RepID=A0A7S2R967_9STRA
MLSGINDGAFCKEATENEVKCTLSLAQGLPSVTKISQSLTAFTCNHVVPPSHIYMSCLSYGPTNLKLDFRHSTRTSDGMCDELGRVLLNCCSIIPAGVVVFLPSYSYEAHLVRRWKKTGIFDRIDKKKKIFREPKNSSDLETCLLTYSRQAISKNGSILLSVIGGKMSEGINFADNMARCVFVVGLPYPDIMCPEMKEKMSSLDRAFREKRSMISGQAYYHNLCMRAVNQSIGRAIRHVNDYAAIILVDRRYANEQRIWNALPFWLRKGENKSTQASFGQTILGLRDFFKTRI